MPTQSSHVGNRGINGLAKHRRRATRLQPTAATRFRKCQKDPITNSGGQVQQGVDLVKDRRSLERNHFLHQEVADFVSDIANASLEQANGIDQVNKALTRMEPGLYGDGGGLYLQVTKSGSKSFRLSFT
jgi:hypothetical protein